MSELSEQEKNTLANAVRLLYSKGLGNKAECIIAVNFDDTVQKLINPPPPAPSEPTKQKETGKK